MACARTCKRFRRDESGGAFLEFTVTMTVFFLLVLGFVDFGYAFYQWNAATKAVQLGARLAAVSDPVATSLTTLTGLEGGALPGAAMSSFDITCNGSGGSCSTGAYNAAAMKAIVFGRRGAAGTSCPPTPTTATDRANIGMCDIFWRIRPENVVIRYQYTGMGYAGRPGGPVPTITVSVTGLTFNFFFLNGFLGLNPMAIPGLNTTITGEDLSLSGPA